MVQLEPEESSQRTGGSALARPGLLSLSFIIFLGYSAIGLPLGAISLHTHLALGYEAFAVGLVVAAQPVATLLSRPVTGAICDTRGGKATTLMGLGCCAASGALYLLSLLPGGIAGLLFLLIGRVLAGFGEGLVITGALGWSIAALGPQRMGRAMVWIGVAMYGAIAIGGPAGLALQAWNGFGAVASGILVLPLLGMGLACCLPAVPGTPGARLPFHRVLTRIWRQGAGLALASAGFGSIGTFIALDFQSKGWSGAGFTVTAFAGAYMLTRAFLGHLPDRMDGTRLLVPCLLVEAAGLLLVGMATSPFAAMAGGFLTGAGFSLIFPSFGVVALKRVPPASRGAALSGYVAFVDVGLMVTAPTEGWIATQFGYSAAFVAGSIAVACGIAFALPSRQASAD